jgi:hypothetical protein
MDIALKFTHRRINDLLAWRVRNGVEQSMQLWKSYRCAYGVYRRNCERNGIHPEPSPYASDGVSPLPKADVGWPVQRNYEGG